MKASRPNPRAGSWLAAIALASLALPAFAAEVPTMLPRPNGKPGDPTKPVQVYLLAGQSNMVGMGEISGAKNMYTGVYLTPDPAAPKGGLYIYPVGQYKIGSCSVYVSADPTAGKGATASIYDGAYAPGTDYDKTKPAKTEVIPLGVVKGELPAVAGPHTVVVRGYLSVPETGTYTINPGYGDSTYNAMKLDGKEVYRKDLGGQAVKKEVKLQMGKRYPFAITYFKGGSTALWLSEQHLLGHGDLETVVKREGEFPWLIDDKGNWTVRKDVYFYDARIHFTGGDLTATYQGKTIGPSLGFGYVMGTYHDQQVLLIKTAMGNRALAFDFRPPSSGRTDPNNKWEGLEWRLMVQGYHKALDNIAKIVPGYKGQGYKIAGYVWWQGEKDSHVDAWAKEYEKDLVNMIHDIRAEFKSPKLPIVIATIGFGGKHMQDSYKRIWQAQMDIGNPKKYPQYVGNVAVVDTRSYWRSVDQSPRSQGYHYNRNAETYMLVGDAIGRAMVRLEGGTAAPQPTVQQPEEEAGPTAQAEDWAKPAAKAALAPMILDGMLPAFAANPRYQKSLISEARGEKPRRVSQFLRGDLYRLAAFYRAAGISDYDWHAFGPDMMNAKWQYFSFDPPEALPKNKEPRYRKVTFPKGMENWYATDFDAAKAGWKTGLPPFGQLGGKLDPLGKCGMDSECRCGVTPRTLWKKEVLMVRGTFDFPPLKKGYRYRIVLGGSDHVNAGEGYRIYVNGKLVGESNSGVGKRQGGQPRGAMIYDNCRGLFKSGKVTIAAISFLRYSSPRGPIPPRGHLTLWMEEQKIPPVDVHAAKE